MNRRILALGGAVIMVSALAAPSPAAALGSAVPGSFVCVSSISVGGVGGSSVTTPLALTSTIEAPPTSDIAAPATARVVVLSASGGALPASPPVDLVGVQVTQLDVRLDVYVTTTNSPTGITGAPVGSALGSKPVAVSLGNVSASTEWPVVVDVNAQLPAGSEGQRLWLRLKEFAYHWTAESSLIVGTTTCRLVANAVPGSGTVETPLVSFFSPLSVTYPEAETGFTGANPATYSSFADRVTVVDASGANTPPPTECTYGPGPCATAQDINAQVNPGTLTQEATQGLGNPNSSSIALVDGVGSTSATVQTTSQAMTGVLNPVTVTDTRGSTAGWSLTGQITDPFTEVGGGVMQANAASISGMACDPVAGSASRHAPSTGAFPLGSAVSLCGVDPGVDDSAGQSGGGQYTVTGAITLTVPAFQKAGEYTSTLVITLT